AFAHLPESASKKQFELVRIEGPLSLWITRVSYPLVWKEVGRPCRDPASRVLSIPYAFAFAPCGPPSFEFAYHERAAFIAGYGTRSGKRLENSSTFSFVDFKRLEVLIQQNH